MARQFTWETHVLIRENDRDSAERWRTRMGSKNGVMLRACSFTQKMWTVERRQAFYERAGAC